MTPETKATLRLKAIINHRARTGQFLSLDGLYRLATKSGDVVGDAARSALCENLLEWKLYLISKGCHFSQKIEA